MSNDSKKPTPQQLLAALTLSWAADTSSDRDWIPNCPSLGQDVATALVVQDFFGGQIWRAPLPAYSGGHYWNIDTLHKTVDFTGGQFVFLSALPLFNKGERRKRRELLESPDTQRRYLILSARVGVWLRWLCKDDTQERSIDG